MKDNNRAPLRWILLCAGLLLLVAAVALAEESLGDRRKRVDEMTDTQKEDILRRVERFRTLDAKERERIVELHQKIQVSPESEKLRETLRHYCHWLATLTPPRRAELAGLAPAPRVQRIKELLQQQAKTGGKRLGDKDREAISGWIEQYATDHEKELIGMLSENRHRPENKLTPAERHRIVGWLCQRWQSGNVDAHPHVGEHEAADLRERLSTAARAWLEAKPPAEQPRLLDNWLRDVARQQASGRRGEFPGFDDQLADFFEKQLNDDERDRLMSLPGEDMQKRLRDMYFVKKMQAGEPGLRKGDRLWPRKRPGPPPGDPPGPPPGRGAGSENKEPIEKRPAAKTAEKPTKEMMEKVPEKSRGG